ncbi:MAG: NIPSNAP family protein [Massilia sp.]
MIVELRTYALHPGAVRTFLDLYLAGPMELQRATLGNLLGYFVTETGRLNNVIHMWGYADLEERDRRRNALAADTQWQKFLTAILPLLQSQESVMLRPTDFSPIR